MGKCVSKHPSVLTIALSEKDLANANQIWNKFAESQTPSQGQSESQSLEHSQRRCHRHNHNDSRIQSQSQNDIYGYSQKHFERFESSSLQDEALWCHDGNQLCEHESKGFVSTKDGGLKQQQQEQQRQRQQEQQQHIEIEITNEKKSGQYLENEQGENTETKASSPPSVSSNGKLTAITRSTSNFSQSKSHNKNFAVDDDTIATSIDAPASDATFTIMSAIATKGDYHECLKSIFIAESAIGCTSNSTDTGTAASTFTCACPNIVSTRESNTGTYSYFHQSSSYEYNANIRPSDGQLCLAHLHLLHHWPLQADIASGFAELTQLNCHEVQPANNRRRLGKKPLSWRDKKLKNEHNFQRSSNITLFDDDDDEEVAVMQLEEEAKQSKPTTDNSTEREMKSESYFKSHFISHQGQSESKKSSKKQQNAVATGVETKGTAMSFGFRKKLNSTPKKLKKLIEGNSTDSKLKHDKCNNPVDERTNIIMEAQNKQDTDKKDNNGNAELAANHKTEFERMGVAAHRPSSAQKTATTTGTGTETATTTATASGTNQGASGQQTNLPGANNRFGFRGIIRPASTGLATRIDVKDNVANNNCIRGAESANTPSPILVSNLKRRSKSAHAGRALTSNDQGGDGTDADDASSGTSAAPKINQTKTLTFNLSHNSTIEYQRQQFFQQPTSSPSGRLGRSGAPHYRHQAQQQQQQQLQHYQHQHNVINTGMHTNVIVRPTPRAPPATFSKFTLHTMSLPKPEFPIAISLSTTTTPTTPGSIFSPSQAPMAVTATSASGDGGGGGVRATVTRSREATQQASPHPLTAVAAQACYQNYMDPKTAKHMANSSTRRGFSGSREISADSGIASMDMALDSSGSSGRSATSPKRSRSRPRNLQMVMNGRHKFEVRDMDDPLSSESSSFAIEPLALPKLPSDNQTVPLPLSGLVRSNTVLSREAKPTTIVTAHSELHEARYENDKTSKHLICTRNLSDDSEGREEKLYLDRSASEKNKHLERDLNTCSSKTSSPGSSIMVSWFQAAGEALATQNSSLLDNSITINDDSNKTADQVDAKKAFSVADLDLQFDLNDEDLNTISSDMNNFSPMSSNYEHMNAARIFTLDSVDEAPKPDRPQSLCDSDSIEKKFAEMALAGSEFLLDDETSPTDSLISSTASDEAGGDKKKKHKFNEELQEKDIDEISPELEMGSPISPGTPTHASRSLSLSDCGNLIDDEIADQPALLFNSESQQQQADGLESNNSRRDKTDTPTLMESVSLRSLKSQSKARTALQHAIELSLRTPMSLRKKVMEHAESLDTLSPCESICSDDLMMDFDMNSSIDSIDRSASIKSRSGSDLHKIDIDDTELLSDLERQGSDLMKELNTILRAQQSNRERDKNRVIAHLPARATRLLNRSRLQQQCNFNADSPDSAKSSSNSLRRSAAASSSRTSSNGSMQQQQHHSNQKSSQAVIHSQHSPHMQQQQQQQYRSLCDSVCSSDDLMLYDKSFRNAMIQDVLQFKKQLLRLRRILQETETINPFDTENGHQNHLNSCLDLQKDADLMNLLTASIDEPIEDINDLRRQVVYLQGQIDDRDRTIRLQRDLIEKLEAEKASVPRTQAAIEASKECINMATQTERTRPLAIGTEGLTRSKPEYTSYTTHFPASICGDSTIIVKPYNNNNSNNNNMNNNSKKCINQTRRHTIISTTLTNYNNTQTQQGMTAASPRRASVAWECTTSNGNVGGTGGEIGGNNTTSQQHTTNAQMPYKPVRITLIGDTLKQWNEELLALQNANEKMKLMFNGGNGGKGGGGGEGNKQQQNDLRTQSLATIVKAQKDAQDFHLSDINNHTESNKNNNNHIINNHQQSSNHCNGRHHQNPTVTIV